MNKYLILGNGFLGNKFKNFLKNSHLSKARINSIGDVIREIEKHNPEFVINCIGKTGRPNIDWCEDHWLETAIGNYAAPLFIADACIKKEKTMVHISSGCIYEGDNNGKGFTEEDKPNFYGSFYSKTKIWAEEFLNYHPILQLRIRMPLDSAPGERSLLDKLFNYKKVIEVPNSITVVPDFLKIAQQLMERNETGTFNVVNKNPITHSQLLTIYEELSGNKLTYESIPPEELDKFTKARRSNCVLSVEKLENLGIKVRDVQEAAKECIAEYIKKDKSIFAF